MRIQLTDSPLEFKRKVMGEYYAEVNRKFFIAKTPILSRVKVLTKQTLKLSPTYKSLVSGDLAAHFGFRKGQEESRLQPILNTFIDSVNVSFIPFDKHRGEFRIFGILRDFSDALTDPEAEIKGKSSESVTVDYPLPWLNWLLLQGNEPIIKDHKIDLVSANVTSSRSGRALMVKGGGWSVPDEFSGVLGDNWITRTIGTVSRINVAYSAAIQKIIQTELER